MRRQSRNRISGKTSPGQGARCQRNKFKGHFGTKFGADAMDEQSTTHRLSLAAIHHPFQRDHQQNAETVPAKRWIKFLNEPMTRIKTQKNWLTISDVNGDGDGKLILVDVANNQCRLKLFQGLALVGDTFLPDEPVGVVEFMSDETSPCLAVGIGGSLLIYRNMKPYYKCNIEPFDLDSTEIAVWNAAKSGSIDDDQLFAELQAIRKNTSIDKMTFLSQNFLTLSGGDRAEMLAKLLAGKAKPQLTNVLISCITTIKKIGVDSNSPDVLVVGTESGSIYWIDTTAFNVLGHCFINGVPDKILTLGEFDLESRYAIALREGDVAILKRTTDNKFYRSILTLRDYALLMAKSKNHVVVATRNKKLIFCSQKVKKLNEIQFNEPILDLEAFNYEPRLYSGVFVAFKDKIDLYVDGVLMDTLKPSQPVEWVKFGRFGREDAVLVIGHSGDGGGMTVMNFRRTAVLFELNPGIGSPQAQKKRFDPTKKTRAFVELTLRERQAAQAIHTTYQRDLFMLRLQVTRSFANLTSSNVGMLPSKQMEKLDISCEINGFGPRFQIILKISAASELSNEKRWFAFAVNKKEYQIAAELIPITKIPVKTVLMVNNRITCLHPENSSQSEVKVFLLSEKRKAPLWMTRFEMPISEQSLV